MKNKLCCLSLLFLASMFATLTSCEGQEVYEPLPLTLMALDENPDLTSEYMVVIGDIQEYTANPALMPYYEATVQWIYSQYMQGMDIKCVLQVGDLTASNLYNEYQSFYNVTSQLAEEIPYIACIGNHDYTWETNGEIADRNQTWFTKYVSFSLTESLIVDRFEEGRMENVIVRNNIWGNPYYILVLEFGPRKEVLEWANQYVATHKNIKFILMTHEYLKENSLVLNSTAEAQFKNTSCSSPEQIWQNLIKDNDNIAWVLCGHNGFYAHLTTKNAQGRDVLQMLFNLQYQKNGGDGMIQLWEFPQGQDSATVRIYNTISRQWFAQDGKVVELKFKYKY